MLKTKHEHGQLDEYGLLHFKDKNGQILDLFI